MNKDFIFGLLVVTMCFSTPLYAQQADVNHYYIGAGASYVMENFNSEFDDTWGINAKVGYHLHPQIDIEVDYNYLSGFDDEDKWGSSGTSFETDLEYEVETYMFVVKGYFPSPTEKARLGVIVGAGIMDVDADAKLKVDEMSYSGGEHEADLCGKVGLGADLFATPDISFGIEATYTFAGFDDLPENIEYFNFTAGIAYHF
jgi:hypothetical protein